MSLSSSDRKTLLGVARLAIQYGLKTGGRSKLEVNPGEYPASLQLMRASFVTLEIEKELRGCIGTLEAHRPLVCDVSYNAHSAAFSDPRFMPLSEQEFPRLEIHISVLSPAEPMQFDSENDLIEQLRPGVDGLILQDSYYRGTFLPSVWDSLPDAKQFFTHLKRKAGLPVDYWSDSLEVYRYTTEYFGDEDFV
jgi:AmmeMemoRadiSam system protein A